MDKPFKEKVKTTKLNKNKIDPLSELLKEDTTLAAELIEDIDKMLYNEERERHKKRVR